MGAPEGNRRRTQLEALDLLQSSDQARRFVAPVVAIRNMKHPSAIRTFFLAYVEHMRSIGVANPEERALAHIDSLTRGVAGRDGQREIWIEALNNIPIVIRRAKSK
jgi:hypothetical protein